MRASARSLNWITSASSRWRCPSRTTCVRWNGVGSRGGVRRRMPRRSVPLELTVEQVSELGRWLRAGSTPQQVALRARIARGPPVALWRWRVRTEGIGCIWEVAAGRGRKPTFGATTVSGWIDRTLQTRPKGSSHWSTRSLAKSVGVSKNSIHRAWRDHQLKPHLTKTFKLSCDPRFVLHFMPTSSSWLNLIECWFSELEQKAVRRGTFRSVVELQAAIEGFLSAWNDNPLPYGWTARVEKILSKVINAAANASNSSNPAAPSHLATHVPLLSNNGSYLRGTSPGLRFIPCVSCFGGGGRVSRSRSRGAGW